MLLGAARLARRLSRASRSAGLQRRLGAERARGLVQRLRERPRRVDAVDLGGQRARLLGERRILAPAAAYARTACGVGGVGAAVDLHAQALEARIAVGQRRRHVAHLLRRRVSAPCGSSRTPVRSADEAVAGPRRLAGHGA